MSQVIFAWTGASQRGLSVAPVPSTARVSPFGRYEAKSSLLIDRAFSTASPDETSTDPSSKQDDSLFVDATMRANLGRGVSSAAGAHAELDAGVLPPESKPNSAACARRVCLAVGDVATWHARTACCVGDSNDNKASMLACPGMASSSSAVGATDGKLSLSSSSAVGATDGRTSSGHCSASTFSISVQCADAPSASASTAASNKSRPPI
mmetsp:Transcript_81514/g.141590  ORF Transcript_81514/g.141590 Transcript_81514/m.141590 type:complete len:209 (-) Transcript_81514:478-1104(-)